MCAIRTSLPAGRRILKPVQFFVPSWAPLRQRITLPSQTAWDFSRAKVVADLGGGGGSLILAVLALNPHLRGMLVDLEPSIDAAKPRFAKEDPSSRCELIAADLMQSVPPVRMSTC